jgi:hypothetical protein
MDGDVSYAACCIEKPETICPSVEFCKSDPWNDPDLCYTWCLGSTVVNDAPSWCNDWLGEDTEALDTCLQNAEVDDFCRHGFNIHGDKLGPIGKCCKDTPRGIKEGEPGCHYWAERCYAILENEGTHIAASTADCALFCDGKEGDAGWCAELLGKAKSSGLGAGAIAGIVVAGVVVVVVIIVVIWCFLARKKVTQGDATQQV